MKVLITGENGFIAKNLKIFLKERSDIKILKYSKINFFWFFVCLSLQIFRIMIEF